MKTVILYATTYGCTKDCAEKLKGQLNGEVSLVNVMSDTIPSINEFDNVIIGGSIYIGQIQKKLKEYCAENLNPLMNKRLALFLCCGLTENFEVNMKAAFPEEMLTKAIAKECFGGELRTEKMKLGHKLMTAMMKKATEKEGKPLPQIKYENISKLAQCVNN